MPIAKIQLADGRIARFEVPDGVTPEQVMQFAQQGMSSPKQESIDPTADMSEIEKGVAGYGKAINDAWRGFKQIVAPTGFGSSIGSSVGPGVPTGLGSFKPSIEKVQAEINESRKLDAPLMESGSAKFGNVLSNIAMTLPTMAIPGANTYAGSALMGGLMGAAQPTAEGESRILSAILGGGLGAAGFGLGSLPGKAVKSATSKVSKIEGEVAERASKQAASETASARSAAGNAAQNAYRQLEHLRELKAGSALTPEQLQVVAQLEKELADKAAEKLLPAAAQKEATAKAYKEAIETEGDRAGAITADKLSKKEAKSQAMARIKRYGPAAVGGALGGMLGPAGAAAGGAIGLYLRPAIRSMFTLAKNPAVQRQLLMPVANSELMANPNLPMALALLAPSINAGQ